MKKAQDVPFLVGDIVRVVFKVRGKTRVAPFEGTVISLRGDKENRTFIVRKIGAHKIAIEKIIPLNSPQVEEIKVLASKGSRRSKLYYLRNR